MATDPARDPASLARLSMSLPSDLLRHLDAMVEEREMPSRSQMIAQLIRRAIADHQAATAGVTLFDRSLIDALTGLTRAGHPADKTLAETHRYDAVYLAPPWPDLFEADDERPHRFEDALAEYEALQQSYPSYGYTVIDLPQAPLPPRAHSWAPDPPARIAP